MYAVVWIFALLICVSDLVIKNYLRFNLTSQVSPLIPKIFNITLVLNKGAAFGVLQGRTVLLIFIGIIFLVLFYLFFKKEGKGNKLFLISCAMILGGAASNMYDRIVLGYVVDYLQFAFWTAFPVFNLSDACITIGTALLFLDSFRREKKDGKEILSR